MTSTAKPKKPPVKKAKAGATKKRALGPNVVHVKKDIPALAEEVYQLMSRDGISALAACKSVGLSWGAFWALTTENEIHVMKYARAREALLDRHAEELMQISDTPVMGTKSVSKATGLEITEGDMIEHRRLQVDTRKWLLSKLLPKKYGDKLGVDHGGSISLTVNTGVPD